MIALYVAAVTLVALLLGAGFLHLLPKLGSFGQAISTAGCRAPLLDFSVAYFTTVPLIVGPIVGGWRGLLGAILGQVLAVLIWGWLHELANPAARKGPRIIHFNARLIGRWQNHAAVWLTALVTPIFSLIRIAEIIVYPPIQKLTRFPKYQAKDWVAVSRQKFTNLVGHDLIWCLYCDWMTGVWSLGTEMLRNVESFWCPIRFDSEKKCANCTQDFPDLDHGWTDSKGTMPDVLATLEQFYPPGQSPNAWFGHPDRLTINGQPTETPANISR